MIPISVPTVHTLSISSIPYLEKKKKPFLLLPPVSLLLSAAKQLRCATLSYSVFLVPPLQFSLKLSGFCLYSMGVSSCEGHQVQQLSICSHLTGRCVAFDVTGHLFLLKLLCSG